MASLAGAPLHTLFLDEGYSGQRGRVALRLLCLIKREAIAKKILTAIHLPSRGRDHTID